MKVGSTYDKCVAFSKQETISLKDYSIEYYLNDPKATKTEDLKTRILVPITQ